jgi:acyl dehydratase
MMWLAYAKILLTRKPALLGCGEVIAGLETSDEILKIRRSHLRAYCRVCGEPDNGETADPILPLAYPHVIAMPLHLRMLSSPEFPMRVLGLVHLRNRIEQVRPLRASESGRLRSWLDNYRETERGQEFDLHTEVIANGMPVWREICTMLKRRPRGMPRARGAPAENSTRASPRPARDVKPASGVTSTQLVAARDVGWRYGRISGDLNPIHLSRWAARAFGFPHAIAHGMWSLGCCAAGLGRQAPAGGMNIDVTFRAPILLPATLRLESWQSEEGTAFVLRDANRDKTHVIGNLTHAASVPAEERSGSVSAG